jgi:hypothetical protein
MENQWMNENMADFLFEIWPKNQNK